MSSIKVQDPNLLDWCKTKYIRPHLSTFIGDLLRTLPGSDNERPVMPLMRAYDALWELRGRYGSRISQLQEANDLVVDFETKTVRLGNNVGSKHRFKGK